MDEEIKELNGFWTDEFSPKNLEEMVLTEEIKSYFRNLMDSKTRFNVLLAGSPGIGKTTLAGIIARSLNAHLLFIKCGLEGNVDTAKTKLSNFCNTMSIDGRPKIVILDELDSASGTQDNSFQKVLRNIISESPDTMFIGTCNYPEKVIAPIKSRLGLISLKFTAKELVQRIKNILTEKGIKYTVADLKLFATEVIKAKYPDVRAIIEDLGKCCSSGTLVVSKKITSSVISSDFVRQLVETAMKSENTLDIRKYYIQNKGKIDDYLTFASEVFNYVTSEGMVTDPKTILALTNSIYQMNVVIDREIAFYGMMMILNTVGKNA